MSKTSYSVHDDTIVLRPTYSPNTINSRAPSRNVPPPLFLAGRKPETLPSCVPLMCVKKEWGSLIHIHYDVCESTING